MKHRGVAKVVILIIVTLGIYGIVWSVKTKEEMKKLGADIPTAWLIIVPIANIYWSYKYAMGVEKITNGKVNGILSFILLYFLNLVGVAIIQSEFNKVAAQPGTTANIGSPIEDATALPSTNPAVATPPAPTPTPNPVPTTDDNSTPPKANTPPMVQ